MRIDPRISKVSLTQNRKKLKIGNASAWAFSKILSTTGTLTYTSISTKAGQEQDINLSGAEVGDAVYACPATNLGNTGLHWQARVKSSGVVSVRVTNVTSGSVTPDEVSWRVLCLKE